MSRYFVTGGAGFIGSHVVRELVKRRHEVLVFDNFSSGRRENLEDLKKKIKIIKGDIRQYNLLKRCMKNADYVIHLAALVSVPKSVLKPVETDEINVEGTLKLLLAAKDNKVKRFVFASSSAVYGEVKDKPIKETDEKIPFSPYGLSKLMGEYYCRMFTDIYKLGTVALRYFNVYGPNQALDSQYASVIPNFIVHMLADKRPPIFGDGHQKRDFVYVKDVVRATLKAATSRQSEGKVFNVASGRNYEIIKVVKYLNSITGKDIKPKFLSPRPGDVYKTLASIGLIKKTIGFKPLTDFKKGLQETLKYYRGQS